MTKPQAPNPNQEPSGGGSEDNGNIHVENKSEWKKRPGQYPDSAKKTKVDNGKAPT